MLVVILTVTGYAKDMAGLITIRSMAGILVVMAAVTALTGARANIIPNKICPGLDTAVAVLWLVGSFV